MEYGEDFYEHVVPGLINVDTSCQGSGADLDVLSGCNCQDVCLNDCECLKRSGGRYNGHQLLVTTGGPIYECHDECSCRHCFNKIVQNGPLMGLEIKQINGKGFGVVTTKSILKDSFVCEYAGEIIGPDEAKRRFQKQIHMNYILVLKEHFSNGQTITIIDPTIVGNIGRYVNHSCCPNLKIVPVRINSSTPVAALFATRNIVPGEELSYDYDVGSEGVKSDCIKCLCGSVNCREFLPLNDNLF